SSALFIPHLSSLPFLLFAPLFSSFFSLSRPPPTSSLFPYTTLFRSVPRGRGPAADRLQPTAAPELLSRFGHRLVACGGTRDHPPRVRTSRARRVPGPGTVGRSRGDGHLATVLGHRAVLARTDGVADDLGRQVRRAAGVGHVHDPADATLDG